MPQQATAIQHEISLAKLAKMLVENVKNVHAEDKIIHLNDPNERKKLRLLDRRDSVVTSLLRQMNDTTKVNDELLKIKQFIDDELCNKPRDKNDERDGELKMLRSALREALLMIAKGEID